MLRSFMFIFFVQVSQVDYSIIPYLLEKVGYVNISRTGNIKLDEAEVCFVICKTVTSSLMKQYFKTCVCVMVSPVFCHSSTPLLGYCQ